MRHKRVELLAPAGDFSCFMAALNAGADAVYLGGAKFGARAYANNFTEEEIIEALHIAHLFDKKIYLTVNTLVKEKEIRELIPYIEPLYEAGLDGVIVQDIGVLTILRDCFPDLALHASTQMAITGSYGAEFMKNMGVCRVVPARELSLNEIEELKSKTGLEIETFVHGAMCYAYSGQCLFSSIIGGRSGNRGRCAGPCRLPYTNEEGQTIYPLSLKDMYTLPMLPKLIQAGIDSFKIEGRMKSPEYVAGVTSVYRKYIDNYISNPEQPYRVSPQDEIFLRNLYIRTDICHGYYKQHNDKSMITMEEPGYSGSSQKVLGDIRLKYLARKPIILVQGYVRIYAGEPAILTFSCEKASATVEGEPASLAVNRPLNEAEIKKRLVKLGDTFFGIEHLEVDTDGKSFMPVKALNELRRLACDQLEQEILNSNGKNRERQTIVSACAYQTDSMERGKNRDGVNQIAAVAATVEQLREIRKFSEVKRIYMDSDLFLAEGGFALPDDIEQALYLALPYILRKRSYQYLSIYEKLLRTNLFEGVLVRNFEELQWLNGIGYSGQVIADYSIYVWNKKTDDILKEHFDRVTVPLELNKGELQGICTFKNKELVLYGRIPLMFSANCVRKTIDKCIKPPFGFPNVYKLTDRYNNTFPIVQNCYHCYNILYNTVPLSLHGQFNILKDMGFPSFRLDFSSETGEETKAVLNFYMNVIYQSRIEKFPLKDYTNGHYKRGVE